MLRYLQTVILSLAVVSFTFTPTETSALAESPKKTYTYVCRNDTCKSKGETHTYEESIPHEHKCPTCNQRMSQIDSK